MNPDLPSAIDPSRSEDSLLDAARSGSVDALGQLFEAARVRLLAVAKRDIPPRLRGKVGASDVVQQTAIDAHRGIVDFVGRSPVEFYGWLRQILRTNIVDSARRYEVAGKRDVRREVSLDDPEERSSAVLIAPLMRRPDDSAIRREEMLAVERALDSLSPDRRQVVWMRHWEGRSFPEIAGSIGCSEGAARKLWYRGLIELHEVIRAMPVFADDRAEPLPNDDP